MKIEWHYRTLPETQIIFLGQYPILYNRIRTRDSFLNVGCCNWIEVKELRETMIRAGMWLTGFSHFSSSLQRRLPFNIRTISYRWQLQHWKSKLLRKWHLLPVLSYWKIPKEQNGNQCNCKLSTLNFCSIIRYRRANWE